jgi:hypothetical protein
LGKNLLPEDIRGTYQGEERHHACSILKTDFPDQWKDLIDVLRDFKLRRTDFAKKGGNKSPIARAIDSLFFERGWVERALISKSRPTGTKPLLPPTMLIITRTGLPSRPNGITKIRSSIVTSRRSDSSSN